MEKLKQIECWEHHYLNQIDFTIKQDLNKMIEGLKSKDKIKPDWIDAFRKSADKNSDFSRGAERIYFWLFNQFGIPNSSPIGADMFFETYNAFVHIDIKTAKLSNDSDYKGKIPLGINQTNYKLPNKNYEVNLPTIYSYKEKLCLTYFISIIYDEIGDDFDVKGVFLHCVPNGELTSIYKDKIYNASKNKGKGFRYKFSETNYFELLEAKPSRIRTLFLSDDFKGNENKLLGLKNA